MALAELDDVLRVLRLEEVSAEDEDRIVKALASAESWAKRFLNWPTLGEENPVTETFYRSANVPVNGTINSVSIIRYPGGSPETLDTNNYEFYDGRLKILGINWVWPGLPWDERSDSRYCPYSVTIEYDQTDVDPLIRDGIALAAAALWYRAPRLGKGLVSESIGGYSYSTAPVSETGDPFFEQAKSILRPLKRYGELVPR